MSKAKNQVIAGDYVGRKVRCTSNRIIFDRAFDTPIEVSDATVSRYEVVDQDASKSATSVVSRGLLGGMVLGTVGMIAGSLSAKNDTIVLISIEFKNGDKSLIEVDKTVYKTLLKILFA